MKLVMALTYQDNLYSYSFEETKEFSVSDQYDADVCVPGMDDPLHVKWNREKARAEIVRKSGNVHVSLDQPVTLGTENAVICFSAARNNTCSFSVQEECTIQVGRSGESTGKPCDMLIDLPITSGNRFRIVHKADAFYVYDEGGCWYLFVNGRQVSTAKLHAGDVLSVMTFQIFFTGKAFHIKNAPGSAVCVYNECLQHHKAASASTFSRESLYIPRSPRFVMRCLPM